MLGKMYADYAEIEEANRKKWKKIDEIRNDFNDKYKNDFVQVAIDCECELYIKGSFNEETFNILEKAVKEYKELMGY